MTKEGAGWLQTHPLPWRHQTRYDQALGLSQTFGESRGLSGLGRFHPALKEVPLPDPGEIWPPARRPRIVLVPGASKHGAIKRWPLRHWIKLAQMLQGQAELRWSLGPEEESLRTWLPAETGVPALPKLGLWHLASALRQADRVISSDTGLLHLAVLLGVPVTAIYGPSDPVVSGLPDGVGQVLRTDIGCSPCRERQCQRRQCLEELEPEVVMQSLAMS